MARLTAKAAEELRQDLLSIIEAKAHSPRLDPVGWYSECGVESITVMQVKRQLEVLARSKKIMAIRRAGHVTLYGKLT